MVRTLHTKELLLLHGTIRTDVRAVGISLGMWEGADLDWVRRAFRQIDRPQQNRASGEPPLCFRGSEETRWAGLREGVGQGAGARTEGPGSLPTRWAVLGWTTGNRCRPLSSGDLKEVLRWEE